LFKQSKTYARPVLFGGGLLVLAWLLGIYEGLRQALEEITMDYIIAGIASAGLFIYLIYALLRPEKF
jgi:K+-transporting ATPase KdpF subunit